MNLIPLKEEVVCRSEHAEGLATIKTMVARGEKYGFYRGRVCIFEVKGKFLAETVIIYPSVGQNLPIFGSEYLEVKGKSFAAVDFHPVGGNLAPFEGDLAHFAPRDTIKSKHYDLNQYFSPKLWLKRGREGVRAIFEQEYSNRVMAYYALLNNNLHLVEGERADHGPFNAYMANHDPARGILKSYFGPGFADDYIRTVLFAEGVNC